MKIETDERGAEFAVDEGFGVICAVEYKERNAQVALDVRGLKIPVKGWIDYSDPAVAEMLEAGKAAGVLAYRIESRRAENIDPTIPFDKLGNFDKFRRYVTLRQTGGEAPIESRPIPNEPAPANGPVANEPSGPSGTGPLANEAGPPPPGPRSGGDRTDTWAYGATLGLVELAFELMVAAMRDSQQKLVVNPVTVRALATRLLAIADSGQLCVRSAVDRNANSHTRARGALRSALVLYPVPFSFPADPDVADEEARVAHRAKETEALDAWQERVGRAVCLLMQVGVEMMGP